MRRKSRAEQDHPQWFETEDVSKSHAHKLRREKGNKSKYCGASAHAHELVDIHFQTRAEHQIHQTDRGQEFHAVARINEVKSMRSDQHAADDDANNAGELHTFRKQRCEENDAHDEQKKCNWLV